MRKTKDGTVPSTPVLSFLFFKIKESDAMQIEVFTQSAIKITSTKKIYFDPYQIKDNYHDADYIFITHDHYDHYDKESIKNILKETTFIIVPECLEDRVKNITPNYITVLPKKSYSIDDLSFETISSYNNDKTFHPKEKLYVGYKLKIEDKYFYIMGDTDVTNEALKVKCDICFVPIGGTYTMNVKEAADYINTISPKLAIPIHYGSIVGDINLYKEFIELINPSIKVEVYIK